MEKAMTLESYRVPAGVREGIELTVPGTDTTFLVKLPSSFNKAYQRAMMIAWPNEGDLASLPMVEQLALIDAQQQAFGDHCLVHPLPDGLTFATLRDEYPAALDWLTMEAARMAAELDVEASDAAKKSLPSSPGKTAGRGRATSTPSSSDQAASPSATGVRPLAAMAG
jgi:hypothetical protein